MLLAFYGCTYVNIRTPYDTDFNQTQLGSKTGTAEAYSLLWLVTYPNFGTMARGSFLAEENSVQTFQGYQIEQEKVLAGDRYFLLQKKHTRFR